MAPPPERDTQLRLRRATSVDVPDIVTLVEGAYRGEASRAGWTTEADLLDGQRTDAREIHEQLADARACFVLAESNARLVGSVLLRDDDEAMYLGMLAVHPTLQGRGVGKRLLEAADARARELERPCVRMTVIRLRHTLIAWYERHGYRRTGQLEPFPYGDERFGRPRRADLVFEVLEKRL
jgi:ribosomal protein S18 acetylase RimI-like enzyme